MALESTGGAPDLHSLLRPMLRVCACVCVLFHCVLQDMQPTRVMHSNIIQFHHVLVLVLLILLRSLLSFQVMCFKLLHGLSMLRDCSFRTTRTLLSVQYESYIRYQLPATTIQLHMDTFTLVRH